MLCGSGPAGEVVTNTQVLYCDGNNRDVTDGAGISGIATDWGGVGRGDEPGSDRQYHLDHRLPLLEEDEGAWEGIEAGMALRYDGGTKVKDWSL